MTIDTRLSNLERQVDHAHADRLPTWAIVVSATEDRLHPTFVDDVERLLRELHPAGITNVVHVPDNGRDPMGPSVSYGGEGWVETKALCRGEPGWHLIEPPPVARGHT